MRKIVEFHIYHYQDQKKCGKDENILVAALLLTGEIKTYKQYAKMCVDKDIAGVSEKTWDLETT